MDIVRRKLLGLKGLNTVYNFTIKRLKQGFVLDRNPLKESEGLAMSISDLHLWLQQFFLQKTCFHGVSSRNYLILKTNETNQGHNIRSLVLNRGANGTIFVLDRVRV